MTQYHRIQYNAMHKFVRVLDKYAMSCQWLPSSHYFSSCYMRNLGDSVQLYMALRLFIYCTLVLGQDMQNKPNVSFCALSVA